MGARGWVWVGIAIGLIIHGALQGILQDGLFGQIAGGTVLVFVGIFLLLCLVP